MNQDKNTARALLSLPGGSIPPTYSIYHQNYEVVQDKSLLDFHNVLSVLYFPQKNIASEKVLIDACICTSCPLQDLLHALGVGSGGKHRA